MIQEMSSYQCSVQKGSNCKCCPNLFHLKKIHVQQILQDTTLKIQSNADMNRIKSIRIYLVIYKSKM